MKRPLALFILVFCAFTNSFAQMNHSAVSFKEIPLGLYLQTGFLFIYSVLGILFLLMFIFYPRQRLNLFFSLYNLSIACLVLGIQFIKDFSKSPSEDFFNRLIGMTILLFILYALGRMKPFFWWFTAYFLCIDFPLNTLFPKQYHVINETVHILFTLVCLSLTIRAFRNKNPGDWLIGLVALAVCFINTRMILFEVWKIQLGSEIFTAITPFIITISVVIYLALRYGRTNISLEQQLIQVQSLSEANLKTEKEKREILAVQNETLEKQVEERTGALSKSLDDLKAAQALLIQSEKMASLGELTAGIAHEIQNPLNFVNNFSDVNRELLGEMKAEIDRNNYPEVKSIADDIMENEQKINHHGKRAETIVKGMLQHSRNSSGVKEPTDISALADEYLRFAFHGLRAKDKNFNVVMKTDFDHDIGLIRIVSQDIGRVLLNLINNAFYAVDEKKKEQLPGYEPVVSVKTRKVNGKVEIRVIDNGNGIPQKVKDKIFQPFFTTKPTGQGTGLGLSLSYDIVKAHSGEIKVDTAEGNYTEFILSLPV
jgi:two-component system, NtrC family, sensor kinase